MFTVALAFKKPESPNFESIFNTCDYRDKLLQNGVCPHFSSTVHALQQGLITEKTKNIKSEKRNGNST
jgi:hypothetical protein